MLRVMRARPLIGVSASLHDFGDYGGVGVQRPLLEAGGLPVTLAQLPEGIDAALEQLDAIVLAPGRDIEPEHYGQERHPLLAPTEPRRDAFELELTRRALERGLPLLGICRGAQMLNVALGGTLAQDVSLLDRRAPQRSGMGALEGGRGGLSARGAHAGAPPPRDRDRAAGASSRRRSASRASRSTPSIIRPSTSSAKDSS